MPCRRTGDAAPLEDVTDPRYAVRSPAGASTTRRRTVTITSLDHRSPRRVVFLRVPVQREHIPVWIFKPSDALEASAGLVVNLSDGGLQVMTAPDDALEHTA